MTKETLLCKCPVCRSLFPVENLTSEETCHFEVVKREIGGKLKRTEAEKKALHGQKPKRGSAHGKIRYTPQGEMAIDIYLPAYENRLKSALIEIERLKEQLSNAGESHGLEKTQKV